MKILKLKHFISERMKIVPITNDELDKVDEINFEIPETDNYGMCFELCGKTIEFSNESLEPITYKDAKKIIEQTPQLAKGGWRLPTMDEIREMTNKYEAKITVDSIIFKNKYGKFTNEFITHGESVDNDKFNLYIVYWLENNLFFSCGLSLNGKYKISKSLDANDVASVKLCREVRLK